ncbi:MAG: ABC transporter ATP-binding protein [Ignisphaera sp.]|nr:ABC transporter ATP-binding protein [Ignisphaera sp.]MCX8167709.1 ABC transporter ATP-binding protein [Ignisphaera sp.]MDW8085273.1 ABC transporter ATP-binding protein [Ignisphaera sp.]
MAKREIVDRETSIMLDRVLEAIDLTGGYSITVNDTPAYVDAVSNVSFYARNNEVLGIAGESGCGKSTLLKILYGFTRAPLVVKKGKVVLRANEQSIDILAVKDRTSVWWKYISYIPQNSMNVLNPLQRIRDHFIETISTHMNVDRDEAYNIARDYVENVGLSKEVLNAYPHQLSGGMRQRIVIALALMLRPRVVLADEPTTAVDVVVQRGVLQMLLDKQRELKNTLIVVTHDMGVQAMVTNRILIMYAGKGVELGATNDTFENPLHPYTKALIESLPRIGDKTLRKGLAGHPPDLINPPPGCRFHPRCPYAMDVCRREEPPIIEIDKEKFVSCWLYVKR